MSLSKIFNVTAGAYPNSLALLFYKDEHSSRRVTYKEMQMESLKVLKICESQKSKYTSQDIMTKSSVYQENAHDQPRPSNRSTLGNDTSITLGEKEEITSITAGKLLHCGVDDKTFPSTFIVGVMCQPGPSSVACLLGIMQNYTYFFISPDWRRNEIKSYLCRVSPNILVVEEQYADKISEISLQILCTFHIFDTKFLCFLFHNDEMPVKRDCEIKDIAYIIQTSGSTGIPKIVYVPHKCIVPNVLDFASVFQSTTEDRIFCASPPTFDPSMIDLFVAFQTGASLVMIPQGLLRRPKLLLDVITQSKITILQATPSLMFSLGKERLKKSLLGGESDLKVLALGGEVLPKLSVLKEWMDAKCKTRIFNLYGITEVSCWASAAEVFVRPEGLQKETICAGLNSGMSFSGERGIPSSAREAVPVSEGKIEVGIECLDFCQNPFRELTSIGDPLSLTVIKLINDSNQVVGENEEGEIYIGGYERVCWIDDGSQNFKKEDKVYSKSKLVSDGNLEKGKSIEISKQKLIESHSIMRSIQKQLIMRRTGDRGVIKDGKIYCLGRLDRQIKRHGQKVSLPEIERQCETLSYIETCHVVLHKEVKLTAFVQINRSSKCTVTDVWKDLRNLLSPWKLPDGIIVIETLPFNSHGKVDNCQLLKLESRSHVRKCSDYDSIQEFVNQLWKRFLGTKKVSDHDNFIKCGGNSLGAIQFVEEIENFIAIKIPSLLDILLNRSFKETFHQIIQSCECNDKYSEFKSLGKARKKLKREGNSENRMESVVSNSFASCKFRQKGSDTEFAEDNRVETDMLINGIHSQYQKLSTASRRGAHHTSKQLINNHSHSGTQLLWKYDLEKCIDSSPALIEYQDGRTLLLVGSHSHKFVCIDVETGKDHWCVTLGDRIESSPCISGDGGRVFVGCYDYNLYCINIQTGEIVWKFAAESEIKSSPTIDDESGCVMFGCHDKHIYCLTADGNMEWKVKLSNGSVFSSPCIVGEQVFSATLDGVVAGINKKTGNINWKIYLNKPIFTSLTPYSKGIIFGNVGGEIFGYSGLGERLWKFKTDGAVFSSAFVKQLENEQEIIAIGCHDRCVYFLNTSGLSIATYRGDSQIYATPFIFGLDVQHVVRTVICETSGKCCLVDLAFGPSGSSDEPLRCSSTGPPNMVITVLESKTKGEIYSSPVVFQNKLFICSRDDFVHCYQFIKQ